MNPRGELWFSRQGRKRGERRGKEREEGRERENEREREGKRGRGEVPRVRVGTRSTKTTLICCL